MNDDKHRRLKDLSIYYLKKDIFKSFLTGFIFFVFPTALIITIFANIIPLYLYNLIYFLGGLCVILIILIIFTNKIVINTLKNYGDRSDELDYDAIYVILNLISICILIILFGSIITTFV